MPGALLLRILIFSGIILGLSVLPVTGAQEKLSAPRKSAEPVVSAASLPPLLEHGATALEGKNAALRARLAEGEKNLAAAAINLKDLQVTVAVLKASLAMERIPLSRVEEVLHTYTDLGAQAKEQSRDLAREMEELSKAQAANTAALATLEEQIKLLQASKQPGAWPKEMEQSYKNYLDLAQERTRLAGQVLGVLEKRWRFLEQEKRLLAKLQPQLKDLEKTWKVQLLKRPALRLSLREQVDKIWESLAALPGRSWQWFSELLGSGRLAAFFRQHLTNFLGLVGFLLLMSWGTRRLRRLATQRFQTWRQQTTDLDLLPLLILGHIFISYLFLLGLILWVALFFWSFGLLNTTPAQLILYTLITLIALSLGARLVEAVFAGKEAEGFLSLEAGTARFYRRSVKIFLAYLLLGFLGLKTAEILGFPAASRQFLEHLFQVGLLIWVLWLLRRPYLGPLLPELPDPAWVRHPGVTHALRGLVLFLLAVIILADLLGFQNLSFYVAQAATWTGLALVIFWFLWLGAATIIHHLLHPEKGWATRQYRRRGEIIQKVHDSLRLAMSIILGIAVVLWSLHSWGIKLESLAWAFRWMAWGPSLGPIRLTVLNVGGAVLVLYVGFWFSRLVRSLMQVRVFPRTVWDPGVQYTISTTLHYTIVILAGLVALNVLGFPLINLALVAGALGVGIGFGLQNIVNNFISGLILLFERPIKVGDMLVIDNQWGLVKEIRVRSTIFETFDRYVLVIPNSELLSGKILNWTHYGAGINRLTLKVGVSYGSDVRQVTQLVTEVCQANPRVVSDPPPQVFFEAYGDSSLNFNIWVHLRTPSDRIPATHELNSAIFEAFNQHGIEIPFPQRDLHVKNLSPALEKPEG